MKLPNRILIIEDDPAVAQGLINGLEQHGFVTIWRDSGASGFEYARQYDISLIVLDVRLPDGSGFDVCRQMRQAGLRQPILMLTVQRDEIDRVLGLEVGADDYVVKPFSLRELVSRIRAHLRRAYGEYAASQSHLLFIHDLVIDQSRGQVRRDEVALNLTPTEFKLLNYLAQHRGQALSRTQIVEALWGHSADPDSERTINVHVRRLREKIEPDPSHPSILLTVPGLGYRLV
jgi:DNA-binding response OmpR family regulator